MVRSPLQVRQLVQLITYIQRIDAVVILFRRIVDLETGFHQSVYLALKPGECAALRTRLGAPLIRLLPHDEAPPPIDTTAVVFLTEQGDGLISPGMPSCGASPSGMKSDEGAGLSACTEDSLRVDEASAMGGVRGDQVLPDSA